MAELGQCPFFEAVRCAGEEYCGGCEELHELLRRNGKEIERLKERIKELEEERNTFHRILEECFVAVKRSDTRVSDGIVVRYKELMEKLNKEK